MKKYFVYELKKSLFVMCALTVIATTIYVISAISQIDWIFDGYRRLQVDAIIISGAVLSIIVPIWKLSYLMKKRSVDLYYSLPLSHTRILAVKFIVGLIILFASFTVAFWIGGIAFMSAIGGLLKCVNFIPLYFSLLIPMAVIYALTAFMFTRANRFVDGIMFVLMANMSLCLVVEVIRQLFGIRRVSSYAFTPFGVLTEILQYFNGNFFKNVLMTITTTTSEWIGFSLVAALGVAAGIGLFFAERRAKAENCEQISESFFGYKMMIPLYACALAFAAHNSFLLSALIAVAAYAVSVLYKRTPKIGWRFALVVGAAFLVGVILGYSYLH